MVRLMKLMRFVWLLPGAAGCDLRLIEIVGTATGGDAGDASAFLTLSSHTLACGWFFCHVMAPDNEFS